MTAPRRFHPMAELFPLIMGDEFDALTADVRANGILDEIVLYEGSILDGRNRYRAGVAAGLIDYEAPLVPGSLFTAFEDLPDAIVKAGPLAFVASKNLFRRNLDESQRAMIGADIATMRQGERTDLAVAEHSDSGPKVSQIEAAKLVQVSDRLIRRAKLVKDEGVPELVEATRMGRITVAVASAAAKLSPEQQREVVRRSESGNANIVRKVVKEGLRNAREVQLAKKQRDLPDKKYGIILADPEWEFTTFSVEGLDRSARNHYPTSSTQDIAARDVQKISAQDCMLCLWVTDLARGIDIMRMWGFSYVSYFVWVKDYEEIVIDFSSTDPADAEKLALALGADFKKFKDGRKLHLAKRVGAPGNGFWNRDRDELMLIGTRGKFVAPAMGTQGESVWFSPRPKIEGTEHGKHSAKPDDAHLWIERLWPNVPKIELNARQVRPGWDAWGNEAPDDEQKEEADVTAFAEKLLSPSEPARDTVPHDPATGEIFEEADLPRQIEQLVVSTQNASVSYVQRKFSISYGRALRIIEQLERDGIVSCPDHRGVRTVLKSSAGNSEESECIEPSNGDVSADDEPSSEAGPPAKASQADTGGETPVDHEGTTEATSPAAAVAGEVALLPIKEFRRRFADENGMVNWRGTVLRIEYLSDEQRLEIQREAKS